MKFALIILTVLAPLLGHAGGGGGLRPGMQTMMFNSDISNSKTTHSLEIVYDMGNTNGVQKMIYGRLLENKWSFQNLQIPLNELNLTKEEINALETSRTTRNWAYIR